MKLKHLSLVGLVAAFALIGAMNIAPSVAAPQTVDSGKQISKSAEKSQSDTAFIKGTEVAAQAGSLSLAEKNVGSGFLEPNARDSISVAGLASPALVLFLIALAAIGWLGRRRSGDTLLDE